MVLEEKLSYVASKSNMKPLLLIARCTRNRKMPLHKAEQQEERGLRKRLRKVHFRPE